MSRPIPQSTRLWMNHTADGMTRLDWAIVGDRVVFCGCVIAAIVVGVLLRMGLIP